MDEVAGRGRPTRADRRRAALIDRLVEIFLAEGFADLGLADLAERLHCSKTTLYAIADSKEQIFVAVVRAYFRRSAERIDAQMAEPAEPTELIHRYLNGIAEQLTLPAPAFFADLDRFAPAREIYRENTRIAALRVQELVDEALRGSTAIDAAFVGVVAGLVMEGIHRGHLEAGAGLGDAEAYRALAALITAGVSG